MFGEMIWRVRRWWHRDHAYAIGRIYEMDRDEVDRIIGERIDNPRRAVAMVHEVGWRMFR